MTGILNIACMNLQPTLPVSDETCGRHNPKGRRARRNKCYSRAKGRQLRSLCSRLPYANDVGFPLLSFCRFYVEV